MTSLDDSLLGIQLDEYRIVTPLGSGGMARVYRALDTKLQRYVALKVIASDFRSDDEYRTRFAREAQSIARLEHPNIVHIYRLGEANGLYYMAMKYVQGVDLRQLIDNYRNHNELIPLEDTVRFVEEIGSALDYAHAHNVIHRDVKPSNIIIDQEGHAILTDFGLAFLRGVDTSDPVLGSPHYMAPEQAAFSGAVVPQSDIYSLGVTLFEMLTGKLPFSGTEPMELARKHVSELPPPPSKFNPAIPPVMNAVVLRCLEKEPQKRYQTGVELSAALRQGIEIWTANGLRIAQPEAPQPTWTKPAQNINEGVPGSPALSNLPLQEKRQSAFPDRSAQGSLRSLSWPRRGIGLYLLGLVVMVLLCGCLATLAIAVIGSRIPRTAAIPIATATTAPATSTAAPSLTPLSIPPGLTLSPFVVNPPPTELPPTATAVILNSAPPDNRDNVPPGSHRLGEFAVEWYCNDQGFGVELTNNQSDWACTNPNGSIRFVLSPTDFDNICRSWYKNQAAFAIRDQRKAIQAYNWSCYEYTGAPTAVPSDSPQG